jgi:hypothetical protein
MSIIEIGSTTPSTPTAVNEADRLKWASVLARFSRIRRGQLGLTIDQAAEMSGLDQSLWVAMEDGRWFPEKLLVCRAIATALQTNWSDFDLLALFARAAHQRG